jgi:hypothetical protein
LEQEHSVIQLLCGNAKAMSVKFEVEHIIEPRGHKPYIIVRHLTPGQNFSVAGKPFLNGVEVEPNLTSPRALNDIGEPRFDLFIFYPVSKSEIGAFSKKMIVELVCEEVS